jgi:hypothetical protein
MTNRDTRDILGGLFLTALGLSAAWYAQQNFDIGNLTRMGPGFFPVGLGLILAALGALIALPAFFRRGEGTNVQWRTLALVSASLCVFAFTLKPMGLIFATFGAALVSSLADHDITWRNRLLVAAGVSLMTYLVFSLGLSMVLPVWPWSP